MTAGLISYDEFKSLVKSFVDTSDTICDNWRIEYGTSDTMYMCKRVQSFSAVKVNSRAVLTVKNLVCDSSCSELSKIHDAGNTDREDEEILSEMEIESEVDESCLPATGMAQQQALTFEYHVLYSDSYSVPVLYFNVFKPDGKRLPLEEVWKLCPSAYWAYMAENKWSTLTQQEHPIMRQPYLQLHPCHTANFMAQMTTSLEAGKKLNYLVTWLSTVAPMAGLMIPFDYIT